MNFFDHKNLGYHLLQLCPKVVKHPVYIYVSRRIICIWYSTNFSMQSSTRVAYKILAALPQSLTITQKQSYPYSKGNGHTKTDISVRVKYVCLSVCLSFHPSIRLPTYLPTYLSIYLFIYLSIHPSILLSLYLSVRPSIHPSIYLST